MDLRISLQILSWSPTSGKIMSGTSRCISRLFLECKLLGNQGWAMFRKPQPLQLVWKVRQYTSNLYGNTPPICIAALSWLLSFEERETPQYASHLYCSTPPICTAVRPPFVRQYFWRNTGGWGHRNVSERRRAHKPSCPSLGLEVSAVIFSDVGCQPDNVNFVFGIHGLALCNQPSNEVTIAASQIQINPSPSSSQRDRPKPFSGTRNSPTSPPTPPRQKKNYMGEKSPVRMILLFFSLSRRIIWTRSAEFFFEKCPPAGTGTKIEFPSFWKKPVSDRLDSSELSSWHRYCNGLAWQNISAERMHIAKTLASHPYLPWVAPVQTWFAVFHLSPGEPEKKTCFAKDTHTHGPRFVFPGFPPPPPILQCLGVFWKSQMVCRGAKIIFCRLSGCQKRFFFKKCILCLCLFCMLEKGEMI